MKIADEFTVDAPIDRAWEVLTDLEGIAPLLPGAQMTGREGDDYLGTVKIKVGPVTSEFAGRASFVERDEQSRTAVIDARGREKRGSGNASATITARLHESGGGATRVTVDTDMKVVGKLAQFGSGMIQQVSTKLMRQFAASLEDRLATGAAAESPESAAGREGAGPPVMAVVAPAPLSAGTVPEPEPIDLIELAGGSVARRVAPLLAAIVAAVVVFVVLRARRR
ncbi:membrane oxidoreductase [Prescottella agglutinans]|uniref:Membrane oxidoreductase n=1 Tax=Prescottella agglutinans TaxID=1644129 RepID=A0A3S3ALE0_9NOCA|nr:SRPBCC family protein [Prescottella agglutinans]RVW11129.1 membrane oxidoreductase [Prescottella agglutinans]